MKKLIALILGLVMTLSLAACGTADDQGSTDGNQAKTITITCINGASEEIQLEVPFDPQKVVTLDAASTDVLANLGLADRIIGTTTPEAYLEEYVKNATNVGSAKTFDLEAIMELQPDIIFMAGRGSDSYDSLTEIAPVVRLTVSGNVVEGTYANAKIIASIFGKEAEMKAKLGDYDARIAAIQALSEGKNAIVGMCTGGAFKLLGNDGRCSIIGNELGFENIGVDAEVDTGTHGNEASFEFVVDKAPDYIFVMDRDAATNAEGAQLAKDIMENELIKGTDAYKNGRLVILEHSGVWYKAEGGFTALGIMLADLESALGLN